MNAPFRQLDTRVLVDNPWHRYCKDRYLQRDGSEGAYYYVDMPASAAVLPLFEDGSTLLLRSFRYLFGREIWEFPIGGVARGGDPLATAREELRQEAGHRAGSWTPLGRALPYKGVSTETCHYYLARDLQACGQDLEASEAVTVHRMPLEEARERLFQDDAVDGQSLAGLVHLERHLAREGV
jgi:ADP-ribose pyrophosphatase